MRSWRARAVVVLAAMSATVVIGAVPAAQADGEGATALNAVLTGPQEVPTLGDPDGRGTFAGVVKGDELCYVLVANRIDTPLAAHIHTGAAGVPGDIVVGLEVPDNVARGCITTVPDEQNTTATLTESELAAILASPADFYVNVHNALFPGGAIRGQLH